MIGVPEPPRIAKLDHDRRGYPIPWNVLRGDDGTPHFTINNDVKTWRAIRESRCGVCGEHLGVWRWFVGGPRSAFDPGGCYMDLPLHRECAEFSLQTCPYLALPKYLGRIDVVHPEKLPAGCPPIFLDETQDPDRPEVMVAVLSKKVETLDRLPLTPYFKPVRPYADWTYWRHGQQITEDEAMPFLVAALGQDWRPPKEWLG